eukprot:s2229_g9.t1
MSECARFADQYSELKSFARSFQHLSSVVPARQHRVALQMGSGQPLLHLQKCRPVGLLLMLMQIHFRVHRVADSVVKEQLEQWKWCRQGWEEWCHVFDEPSKQLSSLRPPPPGAESGNVSLNPSGPFPWDSAVLNRREFLALEKELLGAIQSHLRVSSSGSGLLLPKVREVSCGEPCSLFKKERKVYSQYGLDGILEQIFRCIGVTTKVFVEIGTQYGVQCSTRFLRVAHGFLGYMFDDSNSDERIGLQKVFMKPTFAASLVNSTVRAGSARRGVPGIVPSQLDLLSMDTDGMDFVLWRSMCPSIRPRVLTLEAEWAGIAHWHGKAAITRKIYSLARACGYVLVYVVLHDMVFVRKDVFEQSHSCRSWDKSAGDLNFFLAREERRAQLARERELAGSRELNVWRYDGCIM